MAATALGNIPLSTTLYPASDVDTALQALASGVSEEIASAVSTAWKAGGSKAPTDLTSALLVAANEGKVYNMSASGTTDSNFMEGAGKPYNAGTDIAVINTGTAASPVYKFNVLATQDSSVVKSVNGITPTNGAVTIPNAGASTNGLMTSGDYTKLSGIASGAEVNQNAFAKIAVSGVAGTGDAASATDTLTLVPGNNVTMSRTGKSVTINATVPSGVVTGVVTDSGTASADSSGHVDIHGRNGVTVTREADGCAIIVDASGISGIAAAARSGVHALSGAISDLKNFSKVTVLNSAGSVVTNGTITPASNADESLGFKAGSNVTLSTSGKNIVIAASQPSVPVKDGKISGGSSLLSGTTIVIPVATSGALGVAMLRDGLGEGDVTGHSQAVTVAAVSGAISGMREDLNSRMVSGGTLHSNLVSRSLSNPTGTVSGNTIYAMLAALHASDNTAES